MPVKERVFTIRPTFPGPFVIVDNSMKERVTVAPGLERGPLTEAEKRQYMPPKRSERVERERTSARMRAAHHAEKFGAQRVGGYTPPLTGKTWKRRIARLRRAMRQKYDRAA